MKRLAASLLLFVCAGAWAQARDPSDVSYFISNGDYLDLKVSPDGEHLAALVRTDDAVALLFVTAGDFQVVGGTRAVDGDIITNYQWGNNERVVYEVAVQAGQLVDPTSTGELYAVDIDGKGQKRIFGYRVGSTTSGRLKSREASLASHRILSFLPDDPKHILILEYPWELIGNQYRDTRNTYTIVSRLNIYSGKKSKVETLPHRGAEALADRDGNLRFLQWIDKEADVQTAFRTGKKSEWTSIEGDLGADSSPVLLALDEAQDLAYVIADRGPGLNDTIVSYNFETGEAANLAGPLAADISDVMVSESGAPVAVLTEPAGPRYDYIDETHRLSRLHRGLRQSFPGQIVSIISADDELNNLVIRVSGDRNPGEFYLYNTERKEARFVFANRTWMDIKTLPETTAFSVTARDGIEIPVLLTLPAGAGDEPVPLIVLIHGGPHGVRSEWSFNEEVQLFASRGYATLQVNFRGSGGYGKMFETSGYDEWGGAIIDDIVDALEWVVNDADNNIGAVCAYGGSFGAYASMMLAARVPDRVACVGAYAGVYDLPTLFEGGDVTQLRWGESYLSDALGLDESRQAAFSPVNHAEKIVAPVWLVHGDEDQRAPIEHAELMHEALKSAGAKVEYRVLKGGGHGIYVESERVAFYEDLLAFFDEHLK